MLIMRQPTSKIWALGLVLVLGAACSNGSSDHAGSPTASRGQSEPVGEAPPVNWGNSLPGGKQIPWNAAAKNPLSANDGDFPFKVVIPPNVPSTARAFENAAPVLSITYSTPDLGTVEIVEEENQFGTPEAFWRQYQQVVDTWTGPNVSGSFTKLVLDGNTQALATTAGDGSTSSIIFLDGNGTMVTIGGPSLSLAAVTDLANGYIDQGVSPQ